jgi:AraC family transcriptional regulator
MSALETAGATLIRTTHTATGITLLEWQGRDALLDYRGTARDVLSVSLRGGSRCKRLKDGRHAATGFDDAICMFPAGERSSQWHISNELRLLQICLPPLSSRTGLFREAFQERSPVISAAAHSLAHANWENASLRAGIDGLLEWVVSNARLNFGAADCAIDQGRGQFSITQATQLDDYLRKNFADAVRLDDLAAFCKLSRYHFLRKFKNTFGSSPHAYLTELRLQFAHVLLSDGIHKITSIALECGYSQPGQFAAAFKRHFGYSPSEVRKREPSSNPPTI